MLKGIVITWSIIAALVAAFLWFGYSDLRNAGIMMQYIEENPLRALWRVVFGWTMALLSVAMGIYLTRMFVRKPPV